ncbi:MAG: hypothetical protein KF841_16170 [Phycisphaerae bacterium]|nr:hypothetical protein [Phycisphaerae bacterium]
MGERARHAGCIESERSTGRTTNGRTTQLIDKMVCLIKAGSMVPMIRANARGKPMDEQTFQKKLAELTKEIGNLPEEDRVKLEALAEQTKERHAKLRRTVTSLQESLDYLRLSIKYLLFDLEATRRENGYLRKMLEDQSDGQ